MNGVTLSFIFMAYTATSIASTFFICAGTFCLLHHLRLDHQKGSHLLWRLSHDGADRHHHRDRGEHVLEKQRDGQIISYIGVLLFVGLTAYDTQKLKNMALTQPAGMDGAVIRKGAILGALSLYLDFINLFLMFLRIFGQSRD